MSEPAPRWFYIQNGRRCGPADLLGLVDLIIKVEIPEDALVWHSGLTEWVKASDLPEIRSELPPPVPPARRGAALVAPVGSLEADEIEALAETPEAPGAPPRSHERRDHHRHKSQTKVAGSRRRWLTMVLVVLAALMVGLWLLLKRFNEVPAGVIIREGSAGPGPRSPAAAADADRRGSRSPTPAGRPSRG